MLTRKTKYGLKALAHIAGLEDKKPVQIGTISKCENISHKYLESILLELKKSGILGAKKGKGGGYYLLRDAKDVWMVEVIRLLEGPIAPLPCVSLNFYEKCDDCPDETTCSVHKLMIQVRDKTLDVFKNTNLADLVIRKT